MICHPWLPAKPVEVSEKLRDYEGGWWSGKMTWQGFQDFSTSCRMRQTRDFVHKACDVMGLFNQICGLGPRITNSPCPRSVSQIRRVIPGTDLFKVGPH